MTPVARPSALIQRAIGVGGLVTAFGVAVGLALSFLIIQPVIDAIGADGIVGVGAAAGWLIVVGAFVVVVGVIVGRWRGSMPPLRPLALLLGGLALDLGWTTVSHRFDLWGLSAIPLDTAAGEAELQFWATVAAWVSTGVTVIALALIVVGAVRVLRAPAPEPVAEVPAGV